MFDDNFLILLVILLLLVFPVMTIASFVMALGLRGRVRRLEGEIRRLLKAAPEVLEANAPTPLQPTVEPVPAVPAAAASEVVWQAPSLADTVATPESAPAADTLVPPPRRPSRSIRPRRDKPAIGLEERLGTRWAVWVGGLALALGGAFLVRYAIEEDLLGPGARIVAGLLFAMALLAGGEYLRRRPVAPNLGQGAYIPGVVTAAGTVALFATIYAAYAAYDLLGPAQAFVLLGLVGVGTMYAAALHGPALAGLGLAGAYGAPLLVSSSQPNAWALGLFVFAVTAAAFVLARARLWRWLAVTATLAALAYGVLLIDIAGEDRGVVVAYVLALAALVGLILIYEPHRGRSYSAFDWIGAGALAGLAALALTFANADLFSHTSLATLLVVMALALASGLAFDALAPGAVVAGGAAVACLWIWPVDSQIAANAVQLVPGHLYLPFLVPDALELYLEMAILPAAVLFAATTMSLMRRPRPLPPGLALALAGAGTPVFALATAYLRIESFRASLPFGAVAAGLAVLFAFTTERFLRVEKQDGGEAARPIGGGSSLHAVASCTAVALTLASLIADSALTLAFGLSALGAAWVSTFRPLPALRWCAAGFVLLVLARMGGVWVLAGILPDQFPEWRDIALRYVVPAIAIYGGGLLLRRGRIDLPAVILDFGAIVLAGTGAALAIRLGVRGLAAAIEPGMSLAEAGLYTALAFLAVAILVYRSASTVSPVYRTAAPIATLLGLCLTLGGPLIGANPQVAWTPVEGGSLLNALLPGYVLPGALAALSALAWRWYGAGFGERINANALRALCGVAAFLLGFAYVTLEVHKVFAGSDPGLWAASSAENWGYTIAWLVYGVALLVLGILSKALPIRIASALVIMLAVLKAFLFDLSELEGIWRALSFIGLGLTLMGIGLAYQRLLFGRRDGEPSSQSGEGGIAKQ